MFHRYSVFFYDNIITFVIEQFTILYVSTITLSFNPVLSKLNLNSLL